MACGIFPDQELNPYSLHWQLLFSHSVMSGSLWPHDYSITDFPVLHHLLEFVQTHVHWTNDAIQPSHPLSPPSPVLNLSQHQSLFQWISSSCQVAKVLELQHQSFPAPGSFPVSWLFSSGGQSIRASALVLPLNIQDWFPLGLTDLISLLSKGLSRISRAHTVWKHQFLGAQPSLWSNSHSHAWLLGKP